MNSIWVIVVVLIRKITRAYILLSTWVGLISTNAFQMRNYLKEAKALSEDIVDAEGHT